MIFSITEFNNCFNIRSPSLFSYFNHFLAAQGSDLPFSLENLVTITHEQNIVCSKTRLEGTSYEQTIICRQLFAGHMVGSRHRMTMFYRWSGIFENNWEIYALTSWFSKSALKTSVKRHLHGDNHRSESQPLETLCQSVIFTLHTLRTRTTLIYLQNPSLSVWQPFKEKWEGGN